VASLLATLLLPAALVAGCSQPEPEGFASGFSESNPDGLHGAVLTDRYVVPDVTLTATDGAPYSLAEDTTEPVTLVFFGYTHCPDICQVVMADIASALTRLDERQREQVGMVFVTSDPARDDPAVLREYLDRFNPRFEGLTGDLRTIVRLGNDLGVAVERGEKLPSGGYAVSHGTQILAVDQDDRVPVVWTEGTPAVDLAEDLDTLLDEGVPSAGADHDSNGSAS
jgi:protein SCO1/2